MFNRIATSALMVAALVGFAPKPAVAASDSASPAIYLTHGPRTAKVVALTFDDGWDAASAVKVADILLGARVPATFFPHGTAVRESPGVWSWIAHQPLFLVGDHTATHVRLAALSQTDQFNEIDTQRRLVDEATGIPTFRVLRPPHGDVNDATLAAAAQATFGYVVGWDVDANDPYATASQIFTNVMSQVQPGSVVLMHAGPSAELAALPKVIAALRAHGYAIAPLAQVLGVTIPAAPLGIPTISDTGTYLSSAIGPPAGLSSLDPSAAIDAQGFAHVAYASSDGVWYATDRTPSGAWSRTRVAANGKGVFYGAPSLALSPTGVPSIAYEIVSATGIRIGIGSLSRGHFALRTPRLLAGHLTTPSLAIDRKGVLHLAFRAAFAGSKYGLWRGTATCAACSWRLSRFDSSLVDIQPSIAVDSAGRELIAFRRSDSGAANGTYLIGASTGWRSSILTARPFIASIRFDAGNKLHLALEDPSTPTVYTMTGSIGAWSPLILVTTNATESAMAVWPAGQWRLVVTKWDATNRARLFLERPAGPLHSSYMN